MKKVMIQAATSGYTIKKLLMPQLRSLAKSGNFDIYVMSSPDEEAEMMVAELGIKYLPIQMNRNISPISDMASFMRVFFAMREVKPDIVSVGTPKASLLVLIAAFFLGIDQRVYLLRGLRLEGASGPMRILLWLTEFISAKCSTHTIAVSQSLKEVYCNLKLAPPEKVVVLGKGSSKGVDMRRFQPSKPSHSNSLNSPPPSAKKCVFRLGFVGRLTKDKGVFDAVKVFELVKSKVPNLILNIAGINDFNGAHSNFFSELGKENGVFLLGSLEDCSETFANLDILLLPSVREGLPNVVIEAAACGTPTIAYSATGTIDTISDGRTGFLVKVGDYEAMAEKVEYYLKNPAVLAEHSCNAIKIVSEHFEEKLVIARYLDFFLSLDNEKGDRK